MDNNLSQKNDIKKGCKGCSKAAGNEEGTIYGIKVGHSSETALARSSLLLERGMMLVADTSYGVDIVEVMGPVQHAPCGSQFSTILRVATASDLAKEEQNRYRAQEAFLVAKQKIVGHNLEMKLVTVHFLLEENKILFLFTADQRVDFRDLVKDLVAAFHARIELRQIGVRDETRAVGGLAVCGRDFCCHGVTDQLKPVSIKMVKDQNLSLNSVKISGNCGRLLCCLAYEHDFYVEARKTLPHENVRVKIGDVVWRIHEVNVVSNKILLIDEDGRYMSLPSSNFVKDKEGKWQVEMDL